MSHAFIPTGAETATTMRIMDVIMMMIIARYLQKARAQTPSHGSRAGAPGRRY